MHIESIKNYYTKNIFKADSPNNDKYKQIAEKRAYIEAKTETLEELSNVSILGAIMCGVLDSGTVSEEKKMGKLGLGLVIVSGALLIAKWIKQIHLSHEYDKEIKNDSKNCTNC